MYIFSFLLMHRCVTKAREERNAGRSHESSGVAGNCCQSSAPSALAGVDPRSWEQLLVSKPCPPARLLCLFTMAGTFSGQPSVSGGQVRAPGRWGVPRGRPRRTWVES